MNDSFKSLCANGIRKVRKATEFPSKLGVPSNRKLKISYLLNYSLVIMKHFPVAKVKPVQWCFSFRGGADGEERARRDSAG